jgi:YggT family protein
VAGILQLFIWIYFLIILARVLMSWMPNSQYTQWGQVIFNLTEPVLRPVRNALPQTGGFDFSPMIVIILLQILGQILASMLA